MNKYLYSRRQFTSSLIYGTLLSTSSISFLDDLKSIDELKWINVQDIGVEGKGWSDTEAYFDRLPQKARGLVRDPVWELSKDSAGMMFRFETDSPNIHVRYSLRKEDLAMPHMPATGVSGLDLYAKDGYGIDRWVSVVFPREQNIETPIAENLSQGKKVYSLYLPLYNGVNSLEIGVEPNSLFNPISPRKEKPVLFYGTSIMQGACASRPGMAIPAILGRRFNRPTINLGFSGNGRMEPEVASLLSEQDPCVFIIDCLPNMNDEMITSRTGPLVKRLRGMHKETPILLVEDRSFTNTPFFPKREEYHYKNRVALRSEYEKLRSQGIENLYYLKGDHLLGLDGEGATDGSHPNDLGMMRYADAYEPVLRDMLDEY